MFHTPVSDPVISASFLLQKEMKPCDSHRLSLQVSQNSSINFHLSGSSFNPVPKIANYLRSRGGQESVQHNYNEKRGRVQVLPSSRSDYQLFTGRRPRPLSLPPGGLVRYSSPQRSREVGYDLTSNHFGYLASSLNGINNVDRDNNVITARKSLTSSYTRKFPISYSTPGLSEIGWNSSDNLNPYATPGNVNDSINCNPPFRSRQGESAIKYGNGESGKNSGFGFRDFVYKSPQSQSQCPRYSFHSLPVPSDTNSNVTYVKRNNVNLSLNLAESRPYSLLNGEACSQKYGSLKLRKQKVNGAGMSLSKSFTNGACDVSSGFNAASSSNTLPRSGKRKDGEQLSLFFDILATQEKFVQVYFMRLFWTLK